MMVNDRMPEYCADRVARILNRQKKSICGTKILVLGAAYKQNIDDFRESPAISVIQELLKRGAEVEYYDPWVPKFRRGELAMESLPELTEQAVSEADMVVIATAHTNVDYDLVSRCARTIFDTKNAMREIPYRDNIELL